VKGPAHRREALPWWIFGVAGGLVTVWLGQKYLAGRWWFPAPATEDDFDTPTWLYWSAYTVWFIPGMIAGLPFGWVLIRPVNAVLGWAFGMFNRGFDGVTAAYGWGVGRTLRLSLVVLVVYGGLLFLTYVAFKKAPTGFIPQQDQGRLIVNIQLPDSASLERTQAVVAEVEKTLHGDKNDPKNYPGIKGVAHTVAFSGMSFLLQASSSNFASMFIVLDPFDKRQRPGLSDTAIMAKMRKVWGEKIKDAVVTVYGASPIPGLGSAGGFKIIVEDKGGLGLGALQQNTEKIIAQLKQQPGMNSVTTQFRSRTPQYYLEIDRRKVATLGVSLDDVNQTLDMFLGSRYVNSYNDFGRHWQVTVQAEGDYRNRIEAIRLFQVRNNRGQMVSLGTLVTAKEIGGPISITRYNMATAASISGNVQGVSTGDAINAINKTTADTLPLSMKSEWTEIMFMQLRAGNTAMYVFLLSILCVFLTLSALYESWALPLAVILVVPLCLLCSLAGVLFSKRDVNIFVQIGLVVLVGLACKNAILIVEYAKQLRDEGRSIFQATKEASKMRLRPILMTSFAFIFGVLPLVVASGAGAEMRRSLGTAVFTGMLGVTIFGIFLTPVFFYLITSLSEAPVFRTKAMRQVNTILLWTLVIGTLGLYGLLILLIGRKTHGAALAAPEDQSRDG
jgi:multidrug efflux pump